jgi:nucleotide-binding universal stress UspA family protein
MSATKILVPLDRSELAETALCEALTLAKALNAEVTFLKVVEVPEDVIYSGATMVSIDEQVELYKDSARQYLNGVCHRPEWNNVLTYVAVEIGHPAETILDYCERHGIDRIVIAALGRSGLRRWTVGSVAEKVLRATDRTAVLVRSRAKSTSV